MGAIVVSMTLAFVVRLESARENWLDNRIAIVEATLDAFDPDYGPLPPELAQKLLKSLGLKSIAVLDPGGRREIASTGAPNEAPLDFSHDENPLTFTPTELYQSLFPASSAAIRVRSVDDPPLEIVFVEKSLSDALWRTAILLAEILAAIAIVITLVVWATLWGLVLRPVRRLTSNIIAFGERPQDVSRVIVPTDRRDEIGRAESALAIMQQSLAHELAQRKRLAELGMAVARINHDLRNILSAAQLISDRLATIPDPQTQSLAPRLVATLDRAISFCQMTLTYGASGEQPPERRRIDLNRMVREVVEGGCEEQASAIERHLDIPPVFEVYADPEHLFRVLENMNRNAEQAVVRSAAGDRPKAIRFAAIRLDGVALIEISDTGPGFPEARRDSVFEPFQKSATVSGTGLGLSIAADLVHRNGGTIELAPSRADDFYCGARFLIKLPTPGADR